MIAFKSAQKLKDTRKLYEFAAKPATVIPRRAAKLQMKFKLMVLDFPVLREGCNTTRLLSFSYRAGNTYYFGQLRD